MCKPSPYRPYPLAKKTYKLFKDAGHCKMLDQAVKTNLNFFRSPNVKSLHQSECDQKFCLETVKEIIARLCPRVLLCEGIGTYDTIKRNKLVDALAEADGSPVLSASRRRRIYTRSHTSNGVRPEIIVGILHLSGARPCNDEIEQVAQELSKILTFDPQN